MAKTENYGVNKILRVKKTKHLIKHHEINQNRKKTMFVKYSHLFIFRSTSQQNIITVFLEKPFHVVSQGCNTSNPLGVRHKPSWPVTTRQRPSWRLLFALSATSCEI